MSVFQQKKDGWCGPAALSFALAKQGVHVSQETIARVTQTTTTGGVDPAPLIRFVKGKGMKTKVLNGKEPNETLTALDYLLKKGYSILVDYLAGVTYKDGHYVVYQGETDRNILVFDPSQGKSVTLKKSYFIKNWRDKTKTGQKLVYWALAFKK